MKLKRLLKQWNLSNCINERDRKSFKHEKFCLIQFNEYIIINY